MSKTDVARLRMGALRMAWQQGQQEMWNGSMFRIMHKEKQGKKQKTGQDEQQESWKGVQPKEPEYGQERELQEKNIIEPSAKLPAEDEKPSEAPVFSEDELKKAVVMSVILGPPVCKKRKRYEGHTGRR